MFFDQNCELLSKEYKNARDVLDYQCSCGNISKIRLTHFLRGHRCRECGVERTKDKLRFSYEYVKKTFKDNGCELLSKEYKEYHSFLDYKCACGRKSKISFAHFLSGQRCKKCGIEKMTGENNPSYNPNLTDEDRMDRRKIPEYGIWRKAVYKRDNFNCQKCNKKGKSLNAHHIKNYPTHKELRFDVNNGISFCKECHIEFHKRYGYRNNTQEQLDEFLNLVICV